ncbi:MAG TPA: asparaginase [Candidatus Limnocylindrales bacterium]
MAADVPARIALLATGGTVSTTTRPDGRTEPTLSGRALADLVDGLDVTVIPQEVGRVPSWTLDPAGLMAVATSARDAARDPGVAGVVVSHGTTTLEYTAFLADLVLDVPTPVVLTGAMRRADEPEPDGPANLRDAVTVAASAATRDHGALVVFHGRVIAGDRAWKARRSDLDAFVDLDGDLGQVSGASVRIAPRTRPWAPFDGRLDPAVRLVKAVPGDDGTLLDAAAESAHGIVVEALPGAGGVPPTMLPAVRRAADRLPVVVASRAPFGRLPDDPTGGTGSPLRGLGLLSAGRLTAEQAWLLLMAVLPAAADAEALRRRYREVASPGPTTPEVR